MAIDYKPGATGLIGTAVAVKALAATGDNRVAAFANVPSLADAGYAGVVVWRAPRREHSPPTPASREPISA